MLANLSHAMLVQLLDRGEIPDEEELLTSVLGSWIGVLGLLSLHSKLIHLFGVTIGIGKQLPKNNSRIQLLNASNTVTVVTPLKLSWVQFSGLHSLGRLSLQS